MCFEQVLLSIVTESQMVIFGIKLKETGAKIVAMATSRNASSCFFFKAQYWCQVSIISLILSRDILHFVICLHAVTTYDVIIFLFA